MPSLSLEQFTLKLGRCELSFFYRSNSVGDNGVIRQIFRDFDYRLDKFRQRSALIDYYNKKIGEGENALIIDAGANIGASTVFFSCIFNSPFIYAVEPEQRNFQILEQNCAPLKNIKAFKGAIGSEDGSAYLQVSGQPDWGFRVREKGELRVPVISPNTILQQLRAEKLFPFIFKVDIEGGEADLFSRNLEWVDQFPLIIIELHDWLFPFQGVSRPFIKAMANREFDIVHRGENTFCFNKALLAPKQA
jgi:FkbM family methyltransferase